MPIPKNVYRLLQSLYLALVCANFLCKLHRVTLLAEVVPLALAVALDSQNVLAHRLPPENDAAQIIAAMIRMEIAMLIQIGDRTHSHDHEM